MSILTTSQKAGYDSHIVSTSNPHSVTAGQVGAYTTTQTDNLLEAKESTANKGVANGYAGLDVNGLVPTTQLPTYVNSVAGKTGAVLLTKADVGLSNVDDTADANKEVLTANTLKNARTIQVGATAKPFDGSANISFSPTEIGLLADDNLPERLRSYCEMISDWDLAYKNGFYMGENAAHSPVGGWLMGQVIAHKSDWITQIIHAFVADGPSNLHTYRRDRNAGGFGSWVKISYTLDELNEVGITRRNLASILYADVEPVEFIDFLAYLDTKTQTVTISGSLKYTGGSASTVTVSQGFPPPFVPASSRSLSFCVTSRYGATNSAVVITIFDDGNIEAQKIGGGTFATNEIIDINLTYIRENVGYLPLS